MPVACLYAEAVASIELPLTVTLPAVIFRSVPALKLTLALLVAVLLPLSLFPAPPVTL